MGKQNVGVTCPKGKLKFKYFSSPRDAGMKKTSIPVRVDQEIWKVEKLRNKLFKIAAFGVD